MKYPKMHRGLGLLPISILLAAVATPGSAQAGPAPRGPDFNNDHYDDTAIGAPYDRVEGSGLRAGAIELLYGSMELGAVGPLNTEGKVHHLEGISTAGSGDPEGYDLYGATLAWGDFNGDCFDDLVVGAPYDDVGTSSAAGSVYIYFGTDTGLSTSDPQVVFGGPTGPGTESSASWALFGDSLAAGDFDGDGVDDLAIGMPYASVDGAYRAGAVMIINGTQDAEELDLSSSAIITQASPFVDEESEIYDYFGSSLVTGDFDCNGVDDLAIGHPGEGLGASEIAQAGAVSVVYGEDASPLGSADFQLLHQGTPYVNGVVEKNDRLGVSLAAGDFDGNGCSDLVIGVPNEYAGTKNVGAFNLIYGGSGGLDPNPSTPGQPKDQLIYWGAGGFTPARVAEFGYSLVVGRFNNDDYDDLAVSAHRTNVGTVKAAGAVFVFPGSASRLVQEDYDEFTQNDVSGGSAEQADYFGAALGYGAFYGDDDRNSLLIGASREDAYAGHVGQLVFHANSDFVFETAGTDWFQDDIEGTKDSWDRFGTAFPATRSKDRCGEVNDDGLGQPGINVGCEGWYYHDLCRDQSTPEQPLQPSFCQGNVHSASLGIYLRHLASEYYISGDGHVPAGGYFLGCFPEEEVDLLEGAAERLTDCQYILDVCKPDGFGFEVLYDTWPYRDPFVKWGNNVSDELPYGCAVDVGLACPDAGYELP